MHLLTISDRRFVWKCTTKTVRLIWGQKNGRNSAERDRNLVRLRRRTDGRADKPIPTYPHLHPNIMLWNVCVRLVLWQAFITKFHMQITPKPSLMGKSHTIWIPLCYNNKHVTKTTWCVCVCIVTSRARISVHEAHDCHSCVSNLL